MGAIILGAHIGNELWIIEHHLGNKVLIVYIGREIRLPLRIKGQGMGPKIHFNFELLDIGKVFVGSVHCYEVNTRIVH